MSLQSLDIIRRSATTTPSPEARGAHTGQVAKLIDVSKCIGCKACQVACMEWNDLRDEVGSCVGSYDNPPDLSEQSWTVMKFREYEDEKGKLEWLIRKEGCMHCSDPGWLPEGLPVARRDHPVCQRHRRLPGRELHRLRLLRDRLPVRRTAHLQEGPQGLQVHAVFGPGGGRSGAGMREDLPDRGDHLRQ